MAKPKEGNALLKDAFPDLHSLDNGPHSLPSELQHEGEFETVKKIGRMPAFSAEDFEEFDEAQFSEDSSGYEDEGHGNPHALAWYVPYHLGARTKWGIYFNVEAMTSYAESIYRKSRKLRSDISREIVHTFAWAQVLRHELEHCAHELALATAINEKVIDYSDLYSKYELRSLNREGLATHFEFSESIATKDPAVTKVSPYLNMISSGFDLLAGYDDWDSLNVTETEARFEELLGLDSAKRTISQHRNSIGGKPMSSYITVPIFIVKSARSNWKKIPVALDFRISGINCKKVFRALQREKLRLKLHVELEIRPAANHPQVLTRPNSKGASVPMVCHKNDPIHREFFKQLAELVEMDKMQVVEIIQSAI